MDYNSLGCIFIAHPIIVFDIIEYYFNSLRNL